MADTLTAQKTVSAHLSGAVVPAFIEAVGGGRPSTWVAETIADRLRREGFLAAEDDAPSIYEEVKGAIASQLVSPEEIREFLAHRARSATPTA